LSVASTASQTRHECSSGEGWQGRGRGTSGQWGVRFGEGEDSSVPLQGWGEGWCAAPAWPPVHTVGCVMRELHSGHWTFRLSKRHTTRNSSLSVGHGPFTTIVSIQHHYIQTGNPPWRCVWGRSPPSSAAPCTCRATVHTAVGS
jgi:hypothetical protein